MPGGLSKPITLTVNYRLPWEGMLRSLDYRPEDLNPKLFNLKPIPKEASGIVERKLRLWHPGADVSPLAILKEAIEVRRFEIPGPEWVIALGVKHPNVPFFHPTVCLSPIERELGQPGFVVLTTSGPVTEGKKSPKNLCFIHTGGYWRDTCRFLIFDPETKAA